MLKYVKMILLVGALSAVMSGCIDSKDPDFQISAVAYVIQKNDGPEQTMKTFGTYVAMGGASRCDSNPERYAAVLFQ